MAKAQLSSGAQSRVFPGRIPRQVRSVDFRLLLAFDALISERHVSRAAAAVNLSQPAMSHALAKLRQQFDDPVLARTSTGLEPTPRALELIEPVREAIRQVERLFKEGSTFDPLTSSESFTIRMGDMNEVLFLPPLLQRIEERATNITITVQHLPPSETVRALEASAIDFAVSALIKHSKSVHSMELATDRMVCIMRKGHPAAADRLSTRAFLSLRHLRIVQSAGDMRFVEEALLMRGMRRNVRATTPHWLAASYLIESSDLVTALPESMVKKLNADDRFVVRPLPLGGSQFSWRLYWHRRYDARPAHRWIRSIFESLFYGQGHRNSTASAGVPGAKRSHRLSPSP
jgi:DNA-binding transcriptional LysR family regulator